MDGAEFAEFAPIFSVITSIKIYTTVLIWNYFSDESRYRWIGKHCSNKICWRWWCHCYLAKPPFKEFIQPRNLEIMSSSLVMDSVACTSFSFDGFPPLTGLSSSSVVPCLFLALHVFRWAYGFTTGVPHWPQGFWKTGKNTKFGFVHDIRDVCCPTVSK